MRKIQLVMFLCVLMCFTACAKKALLSSEEAPVSSLEDRGSSVSSASPQSDPFAVKAESSLAAEDAPPPSASNSEITPLPSSENPVEFSHFLGCSPEEFQAKGYYGGTPFGDYTLFWRQNENGLEMTLANLANGSALVTVQAPAGFPQVKGNHLLLCGEKEVLLYDENLHIARQLALPVSSDLWSYSINSSFSLVSYAASDGIHLLNLADQSDTLFAAHPQPSTGNTPGAAGISYGASFFVDNDTKLLLQRVGYEASLGFDLFDVATKELLATVFAPQSIEKIGDTALYTLSVPNRETLDCTLQALHYESAPKVLSSPLLSPAVIGEDFRFPFFTEHALYFLRHSEKGGVLCRKPLCGTEEKLLGLTIPWRVATAALEGADNRGYVLARSNSANWLVYHDNFTKSEADIS